ncbi:nitronate monooxygenase [bacterium]|nr:nitronate monooxygenase [bacterium]
MAQHMVDGSMSRRRFVSAGVASGALAAAGMALGVGASAASAQAAGDGGSNRICDLLGIQKPVVQAFMAEETSPALAAAVSNAGGLGVLELPDADTLDATLALTDKPICAGYYSYDDDTAQLLKDKGVRIVLTPGNDADTISAFHDNGFVVINKKINCTAETMRAAQDAGADVIAVVGFGAGGCGPKLAVPVVQLLDEFSSFIDVPMLAAGGIVDATTAAAAARAGADGAYVGSRFLACEEATCADETKQAIVRMNASDLELVPWTNGYMPMGPSTLRDTCLQMVAEGASPSDIFATSAVIYATMHAGSLDDNGIDIGLGVNMITEVKSAADIVDDIAKGFLA